VTSMVLRATASRGTGAERSDDGAPAVGPDATPLGDTGEHAGEQTEHGVTARDPEQPRFQRADADTAAHLARPGEGEGEERLGFEGERPASRRLADRDA
ncbi:MAG TPA: hypothetical protein VK631_20035, partial [Solirubrobacteraceae bacterium]|nr:hypothetical protein [Solirubrobacteraceae bacterium]